MLFLEGRRISPASSADCRRTTSIDFHMRFMEISITSFTTYDISTTTIYPTHSHCNTFTDNHQNSLRNKFTGFTSTVSATKPWPNRACASAKKANSSATTNVSSPSYSPSPFLYYLSQAKSKSPLCHNSNRIPPRLRRRRPPPPPDPPLPRRTPHRFHNRNLPQRRPLRLVFPAPKDKSRRLQMGSPSGRA